MVERRQEGVWHDTPVFLTALWADSLLQPYIESCQSTIAPDQYSQKSIFILTDSNGKLRHWQLRLFENEIEVFDHEGTNTKQLTRYGN